ncbi:TetR/AcrR family transcriptional regulator [Nocardia shimofusensis]|uniref:TetR/AcrR family transcriptional regulator n=1 Tax=Nocardia shimofusensis TaxID=228596 RepID=UPI0008369AFC|nr:TetR family transcriptional regulator [Nocardia shimofusensis]
MSTADRRTRIADAAVSVIAEHGLRALTHRALDNALDLPPGSVSYYFRTRAALLTAVADRITERSRTDFEAAGFGLDHADTEPSTAEVAHGIAAWLDRLLLDRRADLLTRHALIVDGHADQEIRDRLAGSLFSAERAQELFSAWDIEDQRAAEDFVAVLEGAVFDRFAGPRRALAPGTADSVEQLAGLVGSYLHGLRAR